MEGLQGLTGVSVSGIFVILLAREVFALILKLVRKRGGNEDRRFRDVLAERKQDDLLERLDRAIEANAKSMEHMTEQMELQTQTLNKLFVCVSNLLEHQRMAPMGRERIG